MNTREQQAIPCEKREIRLMTIACFRCFEIGIQARSPAARAPSTRATPGTGHRVQTFCLAARTLAGTAPRRWPRRVEWIHFPRSLLDQERKTERQHPISGHSKPPFSYSRADEVKVAHEAQMIINRTPEAAGSEPTTCSVQARCAPVPGCWAVNVCGKKGG